MTGGGGCICLCELDMILTQRAICVMQGHPSFVLRKLLGLAGGSIRFERSRHSQGVSGSKGFVFSAPPKMSGVPTRSHVWVGRWAGVVSAAQGGWGWHHSDYENSGQNRRAPQWGLAISVFGVMYGWMGSSMKRCMGVPPGLRYLQ